MSTPNAEARVPFIAGNWKLHHGVAASVELATAVAEGAASLAQANVNTRVEVCVAPVALSLHAVARAIVGRSVSVAGQNTHPQPSGAFTGELSPPLLADAGADRCLVGHSERRALFGETDADVNAKVEALLAAGLAPIVCVGETLEEREAGETEAVVRAQLEGALRGREASEIGRVVLAYEPVWAIGTGRTASPEDAEQVHVALRAALGEQFGVEAANATRIVYGGSVKPGNAASLLAQPNIDGALVGGASLKAESFLAIVEAAY